MLISEKRQDEVNVLQVTVKVHREEKPGKLFSAVHLRRDG